MDSLLLFLLSLLLPVSLVQRHFRTNTAIIHLFIFSIHTFLINVCVHRKVMQVTKNTVVKKEFE